MTSTTTIDDTVAPAAAPPLLQLSHVSKHYTVGGGLFRGRGTTVRAVHDVSFELAAGETLGLVGESGCGKSSLGRTVLRLHSATSGRITFDGKDITRISGRRLRELRRDVQVIFQDPLGALNPRMTVGAAVSEALRAFDIGRRESRRDRVAEIFASVGLDPSRMDSYPGQMSGGQLQRVGVARALAVEPRFIVADEVVSALDVSVQAQIINLLVELKQRRSLAYLFIAHDLAVVRHVSDRIAVMYLGKIVELAESEAVFSKPHHPYTVSLLEAVQEPDPSRRRKHQAIQGELPSPTDVPSGCPFRTRCPLAQERCAQEEPELQEVRPGEWVACHYPH